jgi:hypothetical protein
MSTNDQTPDPTPVASTTEPMPVAEATPRAAVTTAPSGHLHRGYHGRAGAVIVMIVGALLFATFAFGAGFAVRGVVDRHLGRGGAGIERGYGKGYGMMGRDQRFGGDRGRGGMMQGYPHGQRGWNGVPQGGGGFAPNSGSVPSTGTTY